MDQEFYLNCDWGRLYCRRYGNGTPLLMIHGACVDSDFFIETAEYLSRWFCVYTYDRRGCGRSDDTSGADHTLAMLTEDAAAVLAHIGNPCFLVAHSAGTVIAMELATAYPGLVMGMVLHEPVSSECLNPDSRQLLQLKNICGLIAEGKYRRALYRFMPLIGETDERARAATKEELAHFEKNTTCFIEKEFETIFFSRLDPFALIQTGLPIAVGVGERSRDSDRWTAAHNLAEKLSAECIYYPGAHNGPHDLPKEFSWLTACAILTMEKCV